MARFLQRASAVFLLCLASIAAPLAQAQTAKSRSALYTEIDTNLPSTTGAITAAILRAQLKNVVASAYNTVNADAQPIDADLTAIAALTTATYGRSLLTLADASAARTSLGTAYATAADITNSLNIATWGDSLTQGSGGMPYPTQLATLTGYTVYNGGVSGETSTNIRTRMVAATSRAGHMAIIWAGRNNYASPTTVKADIAAMVAALGHDRYLVLSVLNGDFSTEYSGQSNYATIIALNADLAATYGTRYRDIRSYLVSLYNPGIGQDVIDYGRDIPPSSLRSDTIHLNTAGYLAVANYINAALSTLQGSYGTVLTPANVANYFTAPPVIGAVTPNAAAFTTVTATTLNLSGTGNSTTFTLGTSPSSAAGGGMQINSSAGAEKWRIGLRGMVSGTEGNNLLLGYYNGSTRATQLAITSAGSLLIGTETDGGNGKLQLPTDTTSAGGIGFGTDTTFYRLSAGVLRTNIIQLSSVRLLTQSGTDTPQFTNDSSNTYLDFNGTLRLRGITTGTAFTRVSITTSGDITGGSYSSSSSILSTSGTSGIGYGTGAGGTVTQVTSKATAVTLSRVTGTITTAADALAASTIVSFTLTNTAIAATDALTIEHVSGGTLGAYKISYTAGAGSATIYIRNLTAGSLSEALTLRFAVIKSVNS